jgi:hypothetical protein
LLDRKPPLDPGADLLGLVRARPARGRERARRDRAIQARLQGLPAREVADRVRSLPAHLREEVLTLVEHPEQVVPLLSELDLIGTLRATGLADAGWLLEFASPEQRVACIDLDCWRGSKLSLFRVHEWVDALVEAGDHVIAAALDEFDPELWVLLMQEMADFAVTTPDASPPDALSEDGMVWYSPHLDSSPSRLQEILRVAFTESPERYWQMVYGAIYETGAEAEEYALLWHKGRLNDLGFPDLERAIELYSPLRVEDAPVVDAGPESDESELVAAPQLPRLLRGALVAQALAELPALRAGELLGYVLAVGNAVAIADRLPLADPESIEQSLRKAVRGIDRGLEAVARARRLTPGQALDRTVPFELFRIGATLDPALRRGRTMKEIEEEEAIADWAVQTEVQEPEIIDPDPKAEAETR